MMHSKRRYCVTDCATVEELADKLLHRNWTLCTAFRFGPFLWPDDSFSEDSIREYAVVHESRKEQIESITVGWFKDKPHALKVIEQAHASKVAYVRDLPLLLDPVGSHSSVYCRLCA